MFIAAGFNQRNQLQRLGGWLKRSREREVGHVSEILFRSSNALIAMLRMESLAAECAREYSARCGELDVKSSRIVFWSPTLVEFLNELSPLLTAIRVAQNKILPLLGASVDLKQAAPKSLADGMKKIDRLGLDHALTLHLTNYWASTGCLVKDYRDVDLHYDSIAHHSFMLVGPPPSLTVVLPDNPEQKSPKNFTFAKNRDALAFCKTAYHEFDALVDKLGDCLGIPVAPIDQRWEMAQLGTLSQGVEQTLAYFVQDPSSGEGFVVGQTAERQITIRHLPPAAKGN